LLGLLGLRAGQIAGQRGSEKKRNGKQQVWGF
jgi:hypothetical protein